MCKRAILSLSLCFTLLLSACEMALPATPEPVTIHFATAFLFGYDKAFYEALLPEFEARYPHITVELEPPVPWFGRCMVNNGECSDPTKEVQLHHSRFVESSKRIKRVSLPTQPWL